MANLFHRTSQKMTVLSKLPLSGPLAKMSEKKCDLLFFCVIDIWKPFFILVLINIVMPNPGILTSVKLIKIHQFKVKTKILVNHSKIA